MTDPHWTVTNTLLTSLFVIVNIISNIQKWLDLIIVLFFLTYLMIIFMSSVFSVCVCVNLLAADRRRQRTGSKRVSLDDILEPVKGELVSHFTLKDIVHLSFISGHILCASYWKKVFLGATRNRNGITRGS